MKFRKALKYAENGFKIRQKNWNKTMYLYQKGDKIYDQTNTLAVLDMDTMYCDWEVFRD